MRHPITSIYLLCLLCLLGLSAQAQQRPVYSQYMYNGLAINPAYAGSQKQFNGTAIIRNQWVNFEGAPKTQVLSLHAPIPKKRIGLGLQLLHETIGVHTDWAAYSAYAYQIPMKKGMLSMGLQLGMNYRSSRFTDLTVQSSSTGDPLIANNSSVKFNTGVGVYYSTRTAYAGISVPYLLENNMNYRTVESSMESTSAESRYYYVTAGKVLEMTDKVAIKPSALLRLQEDMPIGYDLNFTLFWNDLLNTGVSYRSGDAVSMMFQLVLNENFTFGYSYDFITSGIRTHSSGTHEVMLNYRIQLSPEPCHAYF